MYTSPVSFPSSAPMVSSSMPSVQNPIFSGGFESQMSCYPAPPTAQNSQMAFQQFLCNLVNTLINVLVSVIERFLPSSVSPTVALPSISAGAGTGLAQQTTTEKDEKTGFFGNLWDGIKDVYDTGKDIFKSAKSLFSVGKKVFDWIFG